MTNDPGMQLHATVRIGGGDPVSGTHMDLSREEAGDTISFMFSNEEGVMLTVDLDLVDARMLMMDLGPLVGPGARERTEGVPLIMTDDKTGKITFRE